MSSLSIASKSVSSKDAGPFHQIAFFSVSGLAMSMTLVVVGGLQIFYPFC